MFAPRIPLPRSLHSFLLVAMIVSMSLLGSIVTAADHAVVYVSAGQDRKLVLYDFDLETGALKFREDLPLYGSPGGQCLHPGGKHLYVSIRSQKGVAAFRLYRKTGALKHLGFTDIGANAAYLATDRTGRWLFAASYSDGQVSTHPIAADGTVGEKAVSVVKTARCAHAILPDAANRFVLVPHTCPNAVYQFRFDGKSGRLTANDPPRVEPAAGLEPRHLAFHPDLDIVYFDDEKGSSVTAYRYDPEKGTVRPLQTVSTLPEGYSERNSCADIEITGDGRFVYASNRGHNSIAAFGVDTTTGKLTPIGRFSTGDTPRSFNLSPDGRWLVAAGQRSGDLTTYRRDAKSGKLEKLAVYPTGRGPSWVQIVPLGK